MREKQAAGVSVALAGIAVAAGLVFASAGGMFQSSDGYVAPPALSSSDRTGVSGSAGTTSVAITVPPSPSWRVADPTTPRATLPPEATGDDPTTTERASRTPRTPTSSDEPTTTRRGSRTTTTQPGE